MNKLTLQLLARKQLIEECRLIEKVTGTSQSYMLESFIHNNNYNPVIELKKINKKLYKKIVPVMGIEKIVKKLRKRMFYENIAKVRKLNTILEGINEDFKERKLIREFVLNYSQNME